MTTHRGSDDGPSSSSDPRRPDRPRRVEGDPGTLARISGWCFEHRVLTVGAWVAGLALVLGSAASVGEDFSSSSQVPDAESLEGLSVIEEHFADQGVSGRSGTIVFRARQGVDRPEVVTAMEELFALVDGGFPDESGVPRYPGATIVSPYSQQGASQVARDGPLAGQVAFAQVNLSPEVGLGRAAAIGRAIGEHAPAIDGLEVHAGGEYLATVEAPETELIGLGFAVVVLIVAFGSVLAMGMPIAVALGGVGLGVGSTTLLSNLITVPDFTPLLGTMIGLGVGIDYALFLMTRYREGRRDGHPPRAAVSVAFDSSGRAVMFAGATVVISMLGLLLIGLGWISGMGIGISATVLATMVASFTLLPALLGLAGERVEVTRWRGLVAAGLVALALFGLGIGEPTLAAVAVALAGATLLASLVVRPLRREIPRRGAKSKEETFAYRWSRTVQRRPWLWLGVATVALVALAGPVISLRLGFADEGNYTEGTPTRRAYDLLANGFGAGFNGPLTVTVLPEAGSSPPELQLLTEAMAGTPGVAEVAPAQPNDSSSPQAYVITVVPTTAPQSEATAQLVTTLRDDVIPRAVGGTGLDVSVTGAAAVNIDITDFVARRTPIFFAAVLTLSFGLLLMVFRSVLVPVKAVIMNVLSIAAAFGVMVAVFQWGWAGELAGIAGAPINPFMPMMLFAIVFGLSMDYEVFLLSRIREEFVVSGDSAGAVADGLAATARVITAAAAIMVVVFGSLMFEEIRDAQLAGLGLALAVLLDATLVRMLLVPAAMELLGDRNWWMPRWLDWLIPRLNVEGGAAPSRRGVPTEDDSPAGSDTEAEAMAHLRGPA